MTMRCRVSLLLIVLAACRVLPAGADSPGRHDRPFDSGGMRIPMDRYAPPRPGRHPAIVLLHGSGGLAGNRDWIEARVKALADRGYVVFVPHYFARTGTRSPQLITIVKNLSAWVDTVHDALSVVAADPDVDAGRLGVMGLSLGSFVALAEATGDRRVKAVAELFGGLSPAYAGAAERLPPVLILHGERDTTVSVRWAYRLRDLLEQHRRPFEMHVYPDQGHGFVGAAQADSHRRIEAFFDRYLRP